MQTLIDLEKKINSELTTKIKNTEDVLRAAEILLKAGAKNILIKGGHQKTKKIEAKK